MKSRFLILLLLLFTSCFSVAQTRIYQRGAVTRMSMGRCLPLSGGILASLSGTTPMPGEDCPEYTLISDQVVYVIVGKNSSELIPLAEEIEFRLRKNEIHVRIDDQKNEARFAVKEMAVRTDWENQQAERQAIQRAHQTRRSYIP